MRASGLGLRRETAEHAIISAPGTGREGERVARRGRAGRTVLVTGGAGFVGGRFTIDHLARFPDDHVIVLDAMTYAASLESFPEAVRSSPNFEFVYGNVRSPLLVESLVARADVVAHFAAETHVPRSISDNLIFFETDVLGTQTLVSAVVRHRQRVERLVHISTSEVYGSAEIDPMDERHALSPRTPYAAAKCGADRLVHAFACTYELPVVIVRPFNNYGPRQHLEKLVPRLATSALLGEPLTIHGDGRAARDWIHVGDTARGIEAVLAAPIERVRGEVFNLGTGVATSVIEIAREVLALTGRGEELLAPTPERPGQVALHRADPSKAREVLGFVAERKLADGLAETVAWYRENRDWWERLRWMRSVPVTGPDGTVTHW
jgi:dTDP-glucose 4,6-dehydratase